MLYRRAGGNLSPEARRGISYFIKFLDLFGSLGGKLNREVTGMTASRSCPAADSASTHPTPGARPSRCAVSWASGSGPSPT